jgi:hypothetical protein
MALDGTYIYWLGDNQAINRANLDGTGSQILIIPAIGTYLAVVPEPSTALLLSLGVIGMAAGRRRHVWGLGVASLQIELVSG